MIGPADIDHPDVLAEVRAAFDAYEHALAVGDATVLNAAFWDSPDVVRFGIADRQKGLESIARWRRGQGGLPGRRLSETVVTAFGPDAAVVTTLFGYRGRAAAGRQTQTWIRTVAGWRIVSAHVSETEDG